MLEETGTKAGGHIFKTQVSHRLISCMVLGESRILSEMQFLHLTKNQSLRIIKKLKNLCQVLEYTWHADFPPLAQLLTLCSKWIFGFWGLHIPLVSLVFPASLATSQLMLRRLLPFQIKCCSSAISMENQSQVSVWRLPSSEDVSLDLGHMTVVCRIPGRVLSVVPAL